MEMAFTKRKETKNVMNVSSDTRTVTGEIMSRSPKRLRMRVDKATAEIMCVLERQVIDSLVENGDAMFLEFDSSCVEDMWTSVCSFTSTDGLVMNLTLDPQSQHDSLVDVSPETCFSVQVSGLSVRQQVIRTLWSVVQVTTDDLSETLTVKYAEDIARVDAEMETVRSLYEAHDFEGVSKWLKDHAFTTSEA
jgi:hypothetical protein